MQLPNLNQISEQQSKQPKMEDDCDEGESVLGRILDPWTGLAPESPSSHSKESNNNYSSPLMHHLSSGPSSGQSSSTTSSSSSTSMLLSMMQSMPFLVFGPQIAAAAAAAAVANNSNTSISSNQNIRSTNFSIDSILNNQQSHRSSPPTSSNLYCDNPRFQSPWTPWSQADSYSTMAPYMDPSFKYHETSQNPWLSQSHYAHTQDSSSSPPHKKHCKSRDLVVPPEQLEIKSSPKSNGSSSNSTTIDHHHHHIPPITSTNISQKRKSLNRGPRIPFTSGQVAELESKFNSTQYLSSLEVSQLAKRLNLTDNRVSPRECADIFAHLKV